MTYRIIGTGSRGNCLQLDMSECRLIVDCGVPYKALRDLDWSMTAVLLTHEHGDHFVPSTVRSIMYDHPGVWWITPRYMVPEVGKIATECGTIGRMISIAPGSGVRYAGVNIDPFRLHHDVPNIGYEITDSDGTKIMYATDTADLDGISIPDASCYFIEANYDEGELETAIAEKEARGEYSYERRVKKTHLSRQQADRWLADNAGDDSIFVYMHEHSDAHKDKDG